MEKLKKGSFFGVNTQKIELNGLIIADMICPAPQEVPWHFHENPYFSYFIEGHLLEVNKKNTYICTPGTLIFHHSQDPHYNTKHSKFTHFVQLELEGKWFDKHDIKLSNFEGSTFHTDPYYKSIFNRIYKEVKINDAASAISIEALILQFFADLIRRQIPITKPYPNWVDQVKQIINDQSSESLSLTYVANEVGLNSTYLSQMFPKYFNTTFGEYIRRVRVDKAANLLAAKDLTLTQIAYSCGFSDQSHFIRSFKEITGMTPAAYRKIRVRY